MKISNKIFVIIVLFLFNCNLSYASSINNITVVNENNISFEVSNDVLLMEWKVETEIKVMKDINISFVSKDFENKNKLILNLSDQLQKNSSYSLITILWPDGNIDFKTESSLSDKEIINNLETENSSQWINKLVIKNSKIIELYFNNIIEEDELEFKLFNELNINDVKVSSNNKLDINLTNNLVKSSNYILMILSMNDNYWNFIKFDEDLYDISTKEEIKDLNKKEPITEPITEPIEELIDKPVDELIDDNIENQVEKEVTKIENESIEDFALNSAETPDTWPETTVLIFLTLLINSMFFIRKKVIKK